MTRHTILSLLIVCLSLCSLAACKQNGSSNEPPVATLKGDSAINRALRFYAGLDKSGIQMSVEDDSAWNVYSDSIKYLLNLTAKNRAMVDTIASRDFTDFRDSVDFVFYPFSGADFIYPSTIFPDADTYFLCGLEKTGTPIADSIVTSYAHVDSYRAALTYFLSSSYFITLRMHREFHNSELDGVCPILTMLMATADRQIISIEPLALDMQGNIVERNPADTLINDNLLRIRFFKTGSNHEQTLYYMSANVEDSVFAEGLQRHLQNTLPKHRVATYLKAASYLLHYEKFSKMRNFILDNSLAVVTDDSGIRYRHLKEKFDVTFYGHYNSVLGCFGRDCFQPDLQQIYDSAATGQIKPLPFRIGYNDPSNWLVGRRKK